MPAKRYNVRLLPQERGALDRLVSTGQASAYKRTRAQIFLKADRSPQGRAWTEQQMCEAFDVGRLTVERTRQACVLGDVEAAVPRTQHQHPPVPRQLDGAGAAPLITLPCSAPPAGHAKWTMPLYADKVVQLQGVESLSDETVRRT